MTIWLFAAALSVLLLVHNGGLSGLDGETFYQAARSVVDHQRMDVGGGFNTTTGIGGRQYAKSNIGMPLLAAVVYSLTTPITWFAPAQAELARTALVGASMTAITAAIIVAGYWLARTLGASRRSSLIVGIGAVAGTYLLPYSKEFFAEPLTAVGLTIAIDRALAKRPLAAGTGLAVAVLARAQSILCVPALLFIIVSRCGLSGGIMAAGPVGISIVVTAIYNAARFGNPLYFGYQDEGFTMPFLRGADMLLLDPTKSLIVFAPVVMLVPWALIRLWHRDRMAVLAIGSTFAITFGVAAVWHNPNGGWCWGPRLLIPCVPPAVAAVGPCLEKAFHRHLAIGLLIVGFAVSAPAVAVSTQIQQLDAPSPAGGIWPPDLGLPKIGRQAELVPVAAAYTLTHLHERKEDGKNYLRYLTFWQLGVSRMFGREGLFAALAASLGLVLVATWAASQCRLAYETAELPPPS